MNDQRHHVRPADAQDDDTPIGYVLTRREVLALLGGVGAMAFVAACAPAAVASPASSLRPSLPSVPSIGPTTGPTATAASAPAGTIAAALPSCIVRPAQTEGPYYVDEQLQRSDIRPDPSDGSIQEGVPLTLTFLVSRVGAADCSALSGAVVDVWHCNALGVYSDVQDRSVDTTGKKFLRGYQVTDATGTARFTTVYPGWYQGRTVHIHFKIRTEPDAATGTEFTSQLYFDDDLSDKVFASQPYASKGQRTLRNNGDGIFGQGGDQLTLRVTGDQSSGYDTTFEIGVLTA